MAPMPFVKDDGGRQAAGFKGNAGDCVVRAVAIASGLPYMEVYDALSVGSRTQRKTKRSRAKASARDGVNTNRKWFKDWMTAHGWRWVPTMGIGTGCTVHLVQGELPMGRLIVAVARHYTTVIDGVVHDTWNPQRTTETHVGGDTHPDGWSKVKPTDRINRHGVHAAWRASERCVYGYWTRD